MKHTMTVKYLINLEEIEERKGIDKVRGRGS